MVHSWTLSHGKWRTLVSMQIMPLPWTSGNGKHQGRMVGFVLLRSRNATVVTMDVKKNHVLGGKERVYALELINARVIGLLTSSREINLNDVLAFALAAYPQSMFNADGKMNIATSKSTLKQKLQATISERNWKSQALWYDVSALLWVITWPSGKLRVYVESWWHCKCHPRVW